MDGTEEARNQPVNNRLTSGRIPEQLERNLAIYQDRKQGLTYHQLSEKWKISEVRLSVILKRERDRENGVLPPPKIRKQWAGGTPGVCYSDSASHVVNTHAAKLLREGGEQYIAVFWNKEERKVIYRPILAKKDNLEIVGVYVTQGKEQRSIIRMNSERIKEVVGIVKGVGKRRLPAVWNGALEQLEVVIPEDMLEEATG